eukprot:scaffold553_cov238-Pinguiococcus_pyrenoidosus.AAC.13
MSPVDSREASSAQAAVRAQLVADPILAELPLHHRQSSAEHLVHLLGRGSPVQVGRRGLCRWRRQHVKSSTGGLAGVIGVRRRGALSGPPVGRRSVKSIAEQEGVGVEVPHRSQVRLRGVALQRHGPTVVLLELVGGARSGRGSLDGQPLLIVGRRVGAPAQEDRHHLLVHLVQHLGQVPGADDADLLLRRLGDHGLHRAPDHVEHHGRVDHHTAVHQLRVVVGRGGDDLPDEVSGALVGEGVQAEACKVADDEHADHGAPALLEGLSARRALLVELLGPACEEQRFHLHDIEVEAQDVLGLKAAERLLRIEAEVLHAHGQALLVQTVLGGQHDRKDAAHALSAGRLPRAAEAARHDIAANVVDACLPPPLQHISNLVHGDVDLHLVAAQEAQEPPISHNFGKLRTAQDLRSQLSPHLRQRRLLFPAPLRRQSHPGAPHEAPEARRRRAGAETRGARGSAEPEGVELCGHTRGRPKEIRSLDWTDEGRMANGRRDTSWLP